MAPLRAQSLEPRSTVEIGTVTLYYDLDFYDPKSRMRVRRNGDDIADRFDLADLQQRALFRLPEGLRIGDYDVPLLGLIITSVEIDEGSILQKVKVAAVIGASVLSGGAAVISAGADYPDFKEAAPIIMEDVKKVITPLSSSAGSTKVDAATPVEVTSSPSREEDVIKELRDKSD